MTFQSESPGYDKVSFVDWRSLLNSSEQRGGTINPAGEINTGNL